MLKFRFSFFYFLLSLLLLAVEIFIALRMHDELIRPYGGDYLCVIWLYFVVRAFFDWPILPTAVGVLLFSYGVEVSQYFGLADRLGFKDPSVMRVLLGSYFTWTDILCYTLGIGSVLIGEWFFTRFRAGKSVVVPCLATEPFVAADSIMREIWGRADTILFIFAGSSAEFALNKAVDWLYFTGKLPADPLGRLFSTVGYAREIVFAPKDKALEAIGRINAIHQHVEASRGASIPGEAYLDVLFMLIDYSIRSFELLHRRLTPAEKAEVFAVFYRVGAGMGLEDLPVSYAEWQEWRQLYLEKNLVYSPLSADLYGRYRKSLGWIRYELLLQAQILLLPASIRQQLGLSSLSWLWPFVGFYKLCTLFRLDRLIKIIILPRKYLGQVFRLDKRGAASVTQ